MHRKILLALSLACLPSTGCDSQACTLIGCGSTFQIALQRDAWTAGEYTVTVVADGETIECAATLPLQCEAPPACPQNSPFILGLEGCALDPSQHKLGNIEFQQGHAPKSVALQIHQDGALLGEGQYSPTYSESQPNGPDCEPTCVGADSVTLALKK